VDKDNLLKSIAEAGYNVGFGAKKHFATYDIADKAPGWIGFISIAVGILSLVVASLSAKLPSAILTISGVTALYINGFVEKKSDYDEAGKSLTQLFNKLRDLYRKVQNGADAEASHAELKEIESEYYSTSISNQAAFSDMYAHYKFFAQQQHDWIDEQKKFTWRDKVPASLYATVLSISLLVLLGIIVSR
jgi:hypothetical protein